MGIANLPVLSALSQKMRWHQERQGVLAQNVANADTPGYSARDLKAFSFQEQLARTAAPIATATTNPAHFSVSPQGMGPFPIEHPSGFETTPDASNVGLEGQMMKVAQNQMDYQAATTLYSRSVRILKTALGRTG